MKSMYQLAAGHIHQHAGLALSFFYILKRGFCHSWMLCFHLSQSAATNAVNETIVNKSGGNMWAAAGSLDSERAFKERSVCKKRNKRFSLWIWTHVQKCWALLLTGICLFVCVVGELIRARVDLITHTAPRQQWRSINDQKQNMNYDISLVQQQISEHGFNHRLCRLSAQSLFSLV